MSFSQDVKNELKNKSFTSKKRNSKIFDVCSEELRTRLRSYFMESGVITDPMKNYLLEFVSPDEPTANAISTLLSGLGYRSRVIARKGSFVTYLQDADAISGLLGTMGATRSLMDFENMRIYKEMRENVQRKVNCETANLQKTVLASVRQTEDIEVIEKYLGFDKLSPQLREIAELRMKMPGASLNELAEAMSEPIGRSGVNHRLRRLSKIAEELRNNSEENH